MADTGDIKKKDFGKLNYSLVPPYPYEELVKAYEVGAKKYAANLWRNHPMEWSRASSALERHLAKWKRGETHDPDGQLHLAAIAWCAFTLMEYEKFNLGIDDRAFKTCQTTITTKDPVMGDLSTETEPKFQLPTHKLPEPAQWLPGLPFPGKIKS